MYTMKIIETRIHYAALKNDPFYKRAVVIPGTYDATDKTIRVSFAVKKTEAEMEAEPISKATICGMAIKAGL